VHEVRNRTHARDRNRCGDREHVLHRRRTGVAGLSGYTASKFGVAGLTRVAALDYAAHGIRINAIAPGPILTDRLAEAGQATQERVAATVPLGRIGTPGDVAAAALWLCSDQSSFVTGTVLTVDGGRLAGTPAFNTRN
jgi:NAD(P)-dependent dehydrogenase (short-subunit alcohol dehydrogenase family)